MNKKGKTAIIIMAAGQGKRMKSKTAKVLHPLAGRPMIEYVVGLAKRMKPDRIVLVVGHQAEEVRALFPEKDVRIAEQKKQMGTAHAVMQAESLLKNFSGNVIVLSGDIPLLRQETLKQLQREHIKTKAAVTLLTAGVPDPSGYGRIVRREDDSVEKIVEERDASPKEKRIDEINSGIYCFQSDFLFKALKSIGRKNAQKEFYLTDTIEAAKKKGLKVHAVFADDHTEVMGINTRVELSDAEWILRAEILEKLMLKGVTIIDPTSTYIDSTVSIGKDTVIYPNTEIYGATKIGEDCTIMSHSLIRDTRIGNSVLIKGFVFIADSIIGNRAQIGPFSHFRPETVLRDEVKIGNFVEVKKSVIGTGSKAPHLTYIGDSTVGKKVNIGAGTITCNYDGRYKHKTVINDGVFIGSDTQIVAPVKIGKGALIAAGTTVTEDIPPYALTLSRAPQVNKEEWVLRRMEEEKKKKEKK